MLYEVVENENRFFGLKLGHTEVMCHAFHRIAPTSATVSFLQNMLHGMAVGTDQVSKIFAVIINHCGVVWIIFGEGRRWDKPAEKTNERECEKAHNYV